MAKKDALANIDIAMEGAALIEAGETTQTKKVTQKIGNKPMSLKKFPAEWADRIGKYHVGALSDYILIAVAEKMKRDGI